MTAKYTPASLLTVLRILGTSTPGFIDLTSRTCTMTNARTAASKGTDEWFNSRSGGGQDEWRDAYQRRERGTSEGLPKLVQHQRDIVGTNLEE